VPKAAMLTHDYCFMTAATVQKHAGARMCEEVFISFMPLNHASGSIFELFACLVSASLMYFAPDALRVRSLFLLIFFFCDDVPPKPPGHIVKMNH
jgi:long-subunit acyl-CoA synthetase (AMP-forming)